MSEKLPSDSGQNTPELPITVSVATADDDTKPHSWTASMAALLVLKYFFHTILFCLRMTYIVCRVGRKTSLTHSYYPA